MNSSILIIVVILLLSLREREIKPSRMWILPAVFVYSIITSFAHTPLTQGTLLLFFLCLLAGFAVGAWRGMLVTVRTHPVTGKITSKGSIASSLIFIVILLIRHLASTWGEHHAMLSLSTALLFVPLGSMIVLRYIQYTKSQRLQSKGF